MDLHHIEADYSDFYRTDTIFHGLGEHPAVRATKVKVSLNSVPDSPGERAGVHVRVSVVGERIVQEGDHYTTAGEIPAFGLAQSQERYELCRAAVEETLRRHELSFEDIDGFGFQKPWAEWLQESGARATNLAGTASYYLRSPEDASEDVEDDRF